MLRMQIVIEKDRIVRGRTQQLHCLVHVLRDVDHVAFEATGEPAMAPHVVIKQKNTNRMTLRAHRFQTKLRK